MLLERATEGSVPFVEICLSGSGFDTLLGVSNSERSGVDCTEPLADEGRDRILICGVFCLGVEAFDDRRALEGIVDNSEGLEIYSLAIVKNEEIIPLSERIRSA